MDIKQILNNNFFPGRNGLKPLFIILHGTAGGTAAEGIATYFKQTEGGANPVSAHYVIGQDGTIVQCNLESDAAWANGVVSAGHDPWWSSAINPNNVTISIEHCKPSSDNSDVLTPAQQASSFALVADICKRNGIPARLADASGGVIGHYSIDPVSRSRCPGVYPWDALFAYLSGTPPEEEPTVIDLTNSTVASHFSGTDNTVWLCKDNGFIIGHAILDFYRAYTNSGFCGLTALGLPRSNELPVHGFAGVSQQEFERGCLRYDPNRLADNPPGSSGPVYLVHYDQDPRTLADQAEIASLQGEIAALPAGKTLQEVKALVAQIEALIVSQKI